MTNNPSKKNSKIGLVFYISTALVALFVLWGALSPSSLNVAAKSALDWMIEKFGWFYMLITALFIFFVIILALSPYGKIRLGKQDETPDYSWFSWISMLFAAGIGVGFVFWGVAEPVLYYIDPPEGFVAGTREAAVAGLRYGAYHWALHPWAIFTIIGMALAYVQFRKGMPALISSAFYPLLGDKVKGVIGKTIDILAVLATCTGVATTFGLSAMQITGGLSHISNIPNSALTQFIVITIVTILFLISAARGLDKGIKILSNVNLIVAGILLLFVIIFGPTLFIAESFVTTLGGYIANVIPMALTLTPFSESEWLGTNTIFFWAWHISWAPFMGLFIARISRGRTIREFTAGVLIVPSLLAILWFTTFGGTALHIELFGAGGLGPLINSQVELALFALLAEFPLSSITNIVAIILILIFFITSADTASFVLGSMTSNGDLNPKLSVKVIWGLLIAGAACVLLISGGGGLTALQTASIIVALPFTIIMIFMVVCLVIILSRDWNSDREAEKIAEMSKVKVEFRDEFKNDLKDDVYEEVKTEFEGQFKEDIEGDVFRKVTSEFNNDFREGIKEDVYKEIKLEVSGELQDNIKGDVYKEVKTEFRDEVQEEIKEQVYEDVKSDFRNEFIDDIKSDVYDDVKHEFYDEFKGEIYDEMKEKFYDSFKEDIYEEMKEELTEQFKEQIHDEVKKEMNND